MTSAGILFTHYGRVLIAQKHNGFWSGIGGKIESGESPKRAAIRESLEEIFGVFDEDLVDQISPTIRLKHLYDNAGFVLYQATFSVIGQFSSAINSSGSFARNFPNGLPTNPNELISLFRSKGEIRALAILDSKNVHTFKLDKYFKQDLKKAGFLQ